MWGVGDGWGRRAGVAGEAVDDEGGVVDVGGRAAGHVAGGAIVVREGGEAAGGGQGAAVIGVAAEAAVTEVGDALGGLGAPVGVVAGGAAEPAAAGEVAAALAHLLDVPDRLPARIGSAPAKAMWTKSDRARPGRKS